MDLQRSNLKSGRDAVLDACKRDRHPSECAVTSWRYSIVRSVTEDRHTLMSCSAKSVKSTGERLFNDAFRQKPRYYSTTSAIRATGRSVLYLSELGAVSRHNRQGRQWWQVGTGRVGSRWGVDVGCGCGVAGGCGVDVGRGVAVGCGRGVAVGCASGRRRRCWLLRRGYGRGL